MSKTKLKKNRKFPSSVLIISFSFFLLTIPVFWRLNQADLSFSKAPETAVKISERGKKPLALKISKTNINIIIEEGKIKNGKWEVSRNGASHFVGSALPGGGGNIVIYGHNKKNILGTLEFIKVGDEIEIITIDSVKHKYKVREIETVTPNQVEVMNPTNHEVLTIYTCVGLFDSKRLVVKADPV